MTNKQPEALRLADLIERYNSGVHSQAIVEDYCKAAAELRRLHAENDDFRATIDYLTCENAEQIGEIVALKEQRDELLEALRGLLAAVQHSVCENSGPAQDAARAAISKAGGAA